MTRLINDLVDFTALEPMRGRRDAPTALRAACSRAALAAAALTSRLLTRATAVPGAGRHMVEATARGLPRVARPHVYLQRRLGRRGQPHGALGSAAAPRT